MWTLVAVLTIAGNLSRYLGVEDKTEFTYTFNIVPIAIGVLTGAMIGLPLALRMIITCFGSQGPSVPLLHGVGIYGYSYSSFLISSLLCGAIPFDFIQWILITYSAVISCMFLMVTYWADLSTTLDSRKRLVVIAGVCGI